MILLCFKFVQQSTYIFKKSLKVHYVVLRIKFQKRKNFHLFFFHAWIKQTVLEPKRNITQLHWSSHLPSVQQCFGDLVLRENIFFIWKDIK